jgi:uroporphyrinogen-III decarboxylase
MIMYKTPARYKERIAFSKEKIKAVYEHRNSEMPFIVNYMNYWLEGENPSIIPANYFEDPAVMTDFQLRKIDYHMEHFSDDFIPFLHPWFGVGVVPSAMGCEIEFVINGDPAIRKAVISEPEQVKELEKPDPYSDGLMPRVLNAIDYMKDHTDLPVSVTDTQGPLNIALSICGVENLFTWMYMFPDTAHELMELSTDILIEWVRIQKQHAGQALDSGAWPHGIYLPEGSGGVWMSDDDCTQLPADLYREFVVPYNSRVLKAFGGGTIHFCGTADHQLENFMATDGLTGINNFCMGNFEQVKKMQELFEDRIALMVCDFAPRDIDGYFKDLFSVLRNKGNILANFVAPEFALDKGRYQLGSREGNVTSRIVYDQIQKYQANRS